MFNDIYLETSTLGSYDLKTVRGKKVSLWSRVLSQGQKETLQSLYYDIDLVFNDADAEIHLYSLNYYNESNLDSVLQKTKGKQMMFYYQNQNYHETNEQKENELQVQINKYLSVIGKHTGYSWWTYVRHFIIKN